MNNYAVLRIDRHTVPLGSFRDYGSALAVWVLALPAPDDATIEVQLLYQGETILSSKESHLAVRSLLERQDFRIGQLEEALAQAILRIEATEPNWDDDDKSGFLTRPEWSAGIDSLHVVLVDRDDTMGKA